MSSFYLLFVYWFNTTILTAHCAPGKQIKKGVFLTGKVALLKKAPELAGGG
jgi:hypothetical protein